MYVRCVRRGAAQHILHAVLGSPAARLRRWSETVIPVSEQTGGAPAATGGRASGFVLGLGLGGFVDGILLHQILQWHHMVSTRISPTTLSRLETNTLADGLFHSATWLLVVLGVTLTVRGWRRDRTSPSWGLHIGSLLVGWGVFNLLDGVVNHHLLGLHHIRDDLGGPLSWDLGFLAFGAALVAVGATLVRSNRPSPTHAP